MTLMIKIKWIKKIARPLQNCNSYTIKNVYIERILSIYTHIIWIYYLPKTYLLPQRNKRKVWKKSEDYKGLIRSLTSTKGIRCNTMVKWKRQKGIQRPTQNAKDGALRTPVRTDCKIVCSRSVSSSCSTSGSHRAFLVKIAGH